MIGARTKNGRLSTEEALELWLAYRETGDRRLRDRLVLSLTPIVKHLAYQKARKLPPNYEIDDLISCGLEALIRSLDRYDPDKGATIEQFVWTRTHGAILDALRRQDWAPRSLRRGEREMAYAEQRFANDHGRPPTDHELANCLDVPPARVRRQKRELAICDVLSLDAPPDGENGATVTRIDRVRADEADGNPERAAETRDAKERFRLAFRELPEREREVAVLLYVNDLTLRRVGEILGVTESRACQIHIQLKRRLRTKLAEHAPLLAEVA